MSKETYFEVGLITRPHGLKGELTVKMREDVPMNKLSFVFIKQGQHHVPYAIKNWNAQGGKTYLQLHDVSSIAEAEKLKGCLLFIAEKDRPTVSRGEFFADEIVGARVVEQTYNLTGTVADVSYHGVQTFLQIQLENGKDIMLAKASPFVKTYNRSKKTLTVALPDGFLEI